MESSRNNGETNSNVSAVEPFFPLRVCTVCVGRQRTQSPTLADSSKKTRSPNVALFLHAPSSAFASFFADKMPLLYHKHRRDASANQAQQAKN